MTPDDYTLTLLRKAVRGKPLTTTQLDHLTENGYLNDDGTITTKGANALTRKA